MYDDIFKDNDCEQKQGDNIWHFFSLAKEKKRVYQSEQTFSENWDNWTTEISLVKKNQNI